MTAPLLSSGLLTSTLLLPTACTVDVGRNAPSASATDSRSLPWAVPLQRQSSIAGSGLREIAESDLRSGDLLLLQPRRHFVWDPRLQSLFREPRRAVSGEQTEGRCGVKERFALSHPS